MKPKNSRPTTSHDDTLHAVRLWDIAVLAGSLGLTLFVSIVVGVFIGHVVDVYMGTAPWGMIFFALLGAVSGFWSLFKRVVAMNEPLSKPKGRRAK